MWKLSSNYAAFGEERTSACIDGYHYFWFVGLKIRGVNSTQYGIGQLGIKLWSEGSYRNIYYVVFGKLYQVSVVGVECS